MVHKGFWTWYSLVSAAPARRYCSAMAVPGEDYVDAGAGTPLLAVRSHAGGAERASHAYEKRSFDLLAV